MSFFLFLEMEVIIDESSESKKLRLNSSVLINFALVLEGRNFEKN